MSEISAAFSRIVTALDYPMHIVTAHDGTHASGCLVGFGSQCSISPARYWVGLSEKNHTHGVARRAALLVVHFPAAADIELARLFGEETGDDVDKFSRCEWRAGPDGRTPVLAAIATWFAGTIVERAAMGDHTGFVVEPVAAVVGHGAPGGLLRRGQLGFQEVKHLAPGHDP